MIRLRYNRLVESGILRVVAITNPLHMGYTKMALIGIKAEGGKLKEILDRIAALEEVIYLIVVSGSFDIIAEVMCREQEDLLQFLTDKLYKIDGFARRILHSPQDHKGNLFLDFLFSYHLIHS